MKSGTPTSPERILSRAVGSKFLTRSAFLVGAPIWIRAAGACPRPLVGLPISPASRRPRAPTAHRESCKARGPEYAQFDSSFAHPLLHAPAEAPLEPPPRKRQNQTEPQQIREYPRGKEKRAANQHRQAVQERAARQAARGHFVLNCQEGAESLLARQSGPGQARSHNKSYGRAQANPLTYLEKQGQLQKGNGHEQQHQAAQQDTSPLSTFARVRNRAPLFILPGLIVRYIFFGPSVGCGPFTPVVGAC